ncbi:glycosyltransferase [Propioniciclava sinopodophylli]|uniref:Glycosyltransferase n=1 Tax=Propioniciclava sinopodophylli TaxID=1837344 RepID=A0A4Q9KDI0_9ACTN|nr:polysaccharide deacetylase family protein [Propioniciclava sinopodophylli]TBT83131.1 glycosyltransferase [Propioniciclava sinopodophylli]
MERAMNTVRPTADDVPLDFAVIIPCHNVEATLGDQLDALTAQTWSRPWGIVVVNNNSTDGTRNVAARYAERGVRVVDALEGKGVAYARNAGVRTVDAATVAFCDGDDVVRPGWVSAMADGLIDSDIVSGRLDTTRINPPWLAHSRPLAEPGRLPTFGRVRFASGCTCGMTRQVFEHLHGFTEDFVGLEDIEFSLRAIHAGYQIFFVEGAAIDYRLRDDLKSVWRQGYFYGRGRPALMRQARSYGLPGPTGVAALKSGLWLLVHLPDLLTRKGRFGWVWVLANRLGYAAGVCESLTNRRGKQIAITYDDGPGPDTAELVDFLVAENVPATFFVLGEACEARPDVVRHMAAAPGIMLATHSHTHPDLHNLDEDGIRLELTTSKTVVEQLLGRVVTQFRPPLGHRDARVDRVALKLGQSVILWTLNSLDRRDGQSAAEVVTRRARHGDVVLLHDTEPLAVPTTKRLVSGLRQKGFEIVPIDRIIGPLTPGATYHGAVSPITLRVRWLRGLLWTIRHRLPSLRVRQFRSHKRMEESA